MKDEIKKLEIRIEELENQLKNIGSQMNDIDPEKMKVFKEVALQLGFDPDHVCGINECMVCKGCIVCNVCRVCNVCHACINECICGPCNLSNPGLGSGRFGGLG